MTAATNAGTPDTSAHRDGSTPDKLERAIALLAMADDKKEWMRDRWLDQVRWFDKKAAQANFRHSTLRVVAITGGVLVPGLVSVSSNEGLHWLREWPRPLAFVVSLLVAAAVLR